MKIKSSLFKTYFLLMSIGAIVSCEQPKDVVADTSGDTSARVASGLASGTLIVPPSPGSLSSVEGLKQSDDYVVQVRKVGDAYQTCFVYKTLNTWKDTYNNGPVSPQESVSFTNFSFKDTEVEVKITTPSSATSVTIRPLNFGLSATRSGNVITFRLSSPKKISVEINGRKKPLFLFADAPDVSKQNVKYYYGPGVHHIGLQKVLNSNDSVYIAAGAVVEGSFLLADASQKISIKGRGILTMGEWKHTSTDDGWLSAHSAITGPSTHDMVIEGITIANSCAWTIAMYLRGNNTYNNQYRNLKLVSWNGNTDGIRVNGNNNTVDDCFIFNNDDIIMSHGATNSRITNLVAWGGVWGRLYWTYGASPVSNILFENINVIGKEGSPQLILAEGNTTTNISNLDNVTFRNLRIEAHPKISSYSTNKFVIMKPGANKITNWVFENVTIDDPNPDEGDFIGNSTGTISVKFRNLQMKGITTPPASITSLTQARMDKNGYATVNFN